MVAASLAVTVEPPLALAKVMAKFPVPKAKVDEPFTGNPEPEVVPLLSLVKFTCGVALVTLFQLASTALTVKSKGTPTFSLLGVPVLPVVVPAAADSPGIRICNFVTEPTAGVMEADLPE